MCDSENNSHLLYQIEPLKTVQFCVSNSKWRNCLCFYHTDFSIQNAYQYSTDTLKNLITHGNEITYLSTQQIIPPLMKNFFPLPASVLFCLSSWTSSFCWALCSAVLSGDKNTVLSCSILHNKLDFFSICCTVTELRWLTFTGRTDELDFFPV